VVKPVIFVGKRRLEGLGQMPEIDSADVQSTKRITRSLGLGVTGFKIIGELPIFFAEEREFDCQWFANIL
jgi:hypothetical protein